MEPSNLRFGGGVADSVLNPLVACIVLLAILLLLFLPRKYVSVSLLLGIMLIPIGQVLVIGGVHFTVMRILILVGLARCIFQFFSGNKPPKIPPFNWIDKIFVLLSITQLVVFSIQWAEWQAVIKSLGTLLDMLGCYLVLRFFIRDRADVRRAIKTLAVSALVLGVCMLVERAFHYNVFASLGGGRGLTVERGGKIRAQATFETYLTAGAFGATLFPLLVWLWSASRRKLIVCMGFVGAALMALTTMSSTPLLSAFAGVVALALWQFRSYMRTLRWGIVTCLLGLQLMMKAPVWALIARVDLTGASSGYHRYMLIDNFIRHFSDWWLVGYKYYDQWGWDSWDLSNQYVAYGLWGGLITLVLFITLLSISYSQLGRSRKRAEKAGDDAWLFWCFGAALFAHVVAFFGVNYFDQMQVSWYCFLVLVSVSTAAYKQMSVKTVLGTSNDLAHSRNVIRQASIPAGVGYGGSWLQRR